jgi:drug/metabolite transporter (DMT)-like permease
MQKMGSKQYGTMLVFLSALMFGSYGLWSRLIGDAMGNFFQGWTRALIIMVALVPLAYFRKDLVRVSKKDMGWFIVFLVFTSLTQAPIFYAFNHMDIGMASLLFFVSMFLTMNVIGVVFLSERYTKLKIVSAVCALAGMCLVFSFSLVSFTLLAALMAVVNGIASGGEVAFSKKLTDKYSPLYLIVSSWAMILVTNLLLSLFLGEAQSAPKLSAPWLWQLCYSIASLFGFWLVIAGLKYIDASIGALVGLLEIVFSILFGIMIFKESLTFVVAIGGTLIILAAALPSIEELVRPKRSEVTSP